MADELTGTGNFGASKEKEETEERDVDLPDQDARDLTEDPLTDEEQGNEDIHKPSEGDSEGSDASPE
jgi:hypothetical protein